MTSVCTEKAGSVSFLEEDANGTQVVVTICYHVMAKDTVPAPKSAAIPVLALRKLQDNLSQLDIFIRHEAFP